MISAIVLAICVAAAAPAKRTSQQAWLERATVWRTQPETLRAPAFAIADNLYYVGNKQFSSHLLVGSKEIVLIDTPYPEHYDMLVQSIRSVGVDPAKITLVMHTHAHYDHYAATHRVQKLSGAKAAIGAKEIQGPLQRPHVLEPGIIGFCKQHGFTYEPFNIDRLLNHGDTIDIGGTVIHCHHAPGHTRGGMTYTFTVRIAGAQHRAILMGEPGLVTFHQRDMGYPGDRDDFARSLDYWMRLEGDVFLGSHPWVNNTLPKYERRQKGEKPDPFVDPEEKSRFLRKLKADFEKIPADK
jgi:metallo-beta-lactamase class B